MVKIRKEIKTLFLFSLLILLFNGCANQLPPGGGDIDRTPPEIVSVYPVDGTINYKENYFELEFSEYVDKRSFKDAVFISPYITSPLEIQWSGTTVTVTFPDLLKPSTTYVVTIGTDVVDYNNKNRMAQALTFSFSTGDEIFKNEISGKVYSAKPSGVLIFAYKIKNDTTDYLQYKPDFISQAGVDGFFRMKGLSKGTFRLFAIDDKFRDLLFQSNQDKIGIPFKDIKFESNDSSFEKLNFFLTEIDTSKPLFIKAVMTDNLHLLLSFNKEIKYELKNFNDFYLYNGNKFIKPKFIFSPSSNKKDLVLVFKNYKDVNTADRLNIKSISDLLGNVNKNIDTTFIKNDKPDTSKIEIQNILPANNTTNIDFVNAEFVISFTEAIELAKVNYIVELSDTLNRKIPINITKLDDASFSIKPTAQLFPQTDYRLSFKLNLITDDAGNRNDTTIVFKYRTISGLDFTGIMGTMANINLNENPILVLQGVDNFKSVYYYNLNKNANFKFDRVQPGKYLLWAFKDLDSSKTYSYGKLKPFKYAEEFSYYPDTLELKPRWILTDINYIFK